MSNITPTYWLPELKFPECLIDVLLREDTFCIQISRIDGRIFKREFVKYVR